MKLYLSSYRIPALNDLLELVGKPANDTKVALIPNAKDYYAERARYVKIRDVTEFFTGLGFHIAVIDLRKFADADVLQKALGQYDLIWAMGGNTFNLRYEMQRSGFEIAIRGLLKAGKVYGGESAGALVAGNNLRGIEYADDSEFAEKVLWDGLKLTDHFVLPHVGSADFKDVIQKAREIHKDDKTMVEVTDSQAFVVNGTDARVIEASEK